MNRSHAFQKEDQKVAVSAASEHDNLLFFFVSLTADHGGGVTHGGGMSSRGFHSFTRGGGDV